MIENLLLHLSLCFGIIGSSILIMLKLGMQFVDVMLTGGILSLKNVIFHLWCALIELLSPLKDYIVLKGILLTHSRPSCLVPDFKCLLVMWLYIFLPPFFHLLQSLLLNFLIFPQLFSLSLNNFFPLQTLLILLILTIRPPFIQKLIFPFFLHIQFPLIIR